MSRITNGFEKREMNGRQASQIFYWPADVQQLLAHARALEDALSVLLPIVQDAKPTLDLSNFDNLLE